MKSNNRNSYHHHHNDRRNHDEDVVNNDDDNHNNLINEDSPLLPSSSYQEESTSTTTYNTSSPKQSHNNNETDTSMDKVNNDEENTALPTSISLDTLADSINFIIQRDSTIALQTNDAKLSPWKLDSIVGSPMISSPHYSNYLLSIPDLERRRKDQIDRYYRLKEIEKYNKRKENELKKKYSAEDIHTNNNHNDDNIHQFHQLGNVEYVDIEHEDEQWERKRKAKLHQVIQKSSSNNSFGSSSTGGLSSKSYSPTLEMLNALKQEFAKTKTPPSVAIMYGIINTVIVLPVLMSFGSIIYHDDFFRPYLPILIKLTVISGVVHQFSFSTFSTLPFAVSNHNNLLSIFIFFLK